MDHYKVYFDGHDDNSHSAPAWMDQDSKWRSWNAAGSTSSPGPEGPTCSEGDLEFCYDSCEARLGGCDARGCDWTTCVNDVGWVKHVLTWRLSRDLCMDIDRVYATGFSNGAMFTYELGVAMGSQLAAVVPFAGSWHPGFLRTPAVPVPLMDVHGSQDMEVPANLTTSHDGWFYVIVDTITNAWASANGCHDSMGTDVGGGAESGSGNSVKRTSAFGRQYVTEGVSPSVHVGNSSNSDGDGSDLALWCTTTQVWKAGEPGGTGARGGGCDYAPVVRCSWQGYHEMPRFGSELMWRFARDFTRSGLDAAAASERQARRTGGHARSGQVTSKMMRAIAVGLTSFAIGMFILGMFICGCHFRRRMNTALHEKLARSERLTAFPDWPRVVLDSERIRPVVGDGGVSASTEMQPVADVTPHREYMGVELVEDENVNHIHNRLPLNTKP